MCAAKSILFCVVLSIGGLNLSNALSTRSNYSITENEENKQLAYVNKEQEENILQPPKEKKSVVNDKNQTTNNGLKTSSLNDILNHLQKCKQTAVIWFSCYSNR